MVTYKRNPLILCVSYETHERIIFYAKIQLIELRKFVAMCSITFLLPLNSLSALSSSLFLFIHLCLGHLKYILKLLQNDFANAFGNKLCLHIDFEVKSLPLPYSFFFTCRLIYAVCMLICVRVRGNV